MTGSDYYEYSAGHFAEMVHEKFLGTLYENEHTMSGGAAHRFETSELKLRNVLISVSTHGATLGDSSNQRYPIPAGTTLSLWDVDISLMWFRNAIDGQNAKINVIGTRG